MGIVTWLNIKTEYRPKQQKAYFAGFEELEDAAEPIYKMQRRHVGNECFVLNRFLLAQLLAEKSGDFEKLMAELPPYTLVLVIAGAPRRPLERIAYEEEAMEIAASLNFELAKTVGGIAGLETTMLEKLRNLPAAATTGKPGSRIPRRIFSLLPPWTGAQYYTISPSGYAACYGLNINEVGIYMQPLERGRACHLQFSLPCDLRMRQSVKMSDPLHLELSEQLIVEGAFFTRPYGPWADMVYRRTSSYTAMLKELKKIFDPEPYSESGQTLFLI